MHVLQVTPRYNPHTGGVEQQVAEVSRRLVDRGHRVTVVTADAGAEIPAEELRNGVRVKRHRGFAPGGAFHLSPGVVAAVLRQGEIDVVHAHDVHSLPLTAALFVAEEPTVATTYYHGGSASVLRATLWRGYGPLAGAALRRSDAVVAVSEWERKSLHSDFDVCPTVIRIGIDHEKFAVRPSPTVDRRYLLCVARLEKYKGIQHAIRSLTELPGYDLLVVGDGPYREDLERIAQSVGVSDRVEFLGHVNHDDLPGYYAGAAAYVSLSSFESFGITVGEALASGTPCVVSTGSALAEWEEYEGCTAINSSSPEAIAEAVERIVDTNPSPGQVPTWEDTVEGYLNVYRSIT